MYQQARTSNYLDEGLPKNCQIKVSKKTIFFSAVQVVGSVLALSTKRFTHWTSTDWIIWVKNSVFVIQHIGNGKRSLRCFPSIDQANHFAYSCILTLHSSYKNGMLDPWGKAVKTLKTNYYKSSLVTTCVQTCSSISIYNGMYIVCKYDTLMRKGQTYWTINKIGIICMKDIYR